jgi:hypothetical protein
MEELMDIVTNLQLDTLQRENEQLKKDLNTRPQFPVGPQSLFGGLAGGYGGLGASQHAPAPSPPSVPLGVDVVGHVAITAAVTTALTSLPKQSKARVATPNHFDGSKKKVESFLRQCNGWINDNKVTDDQGRIHLVGLYFKEGKAAEWATQNSKEHKTWLGFKMGVGKPAKQVTRGQVR